MGAARRTPRRRRCTGCCSGRDAPGRARRSRPQSLHDERGRGAHASAPGRSRGGPVSEEALSGRPARDDGLPADDRRARGARVHPVRRHRPGGGRRTPRSAQRPREPDATGGSGRQRARGARRTTSRRGRRRARAQRRRSPGDRGCSPMADLPAGATFGSLVHAVLEHADPQAADLRAELRGQVREQLVRWPVPVDRRRRWPTRWCRCCDTPLGPLAAGVTLRDIGAARPAARDGLRAAAGRRRRARRPGRGRTLGDVAPLLRAHLPRRRPAAPLRRRRSRAPALGGQPLRGYLTGSSTWCCGCPTATAGRATWSSTTRPTGSAPTDAAADRRRLPPEALAAAMTHSDYPLQALLYSVVLHRFLRWRQPGYDPERAPRRRALPLRARHVRARTPRWSTASRAGCSPGGRRRRWSRRCLGPARRRPGIRPHGVAARVDSELLRGTEPTGRARRRRRRLALGATGLLRDFNRGRRARPPPTCTSPSRLAGWAARATSGCCSRSRWPCARCATARSCVDLATVADVAPDLALAGPGRPGRQRGAPASPLVGCRRRAALDAAGCSTSTATGGRRAARAPTCWRAPAQPAPEVDAAALTRGAAAASSPAPTLRRAARRAAPRRRAAVDHRAHRRARHRQDHHRRRAAGAAGRAGGSRRAPPLRIALTAPTGKAAARLQEAVAAAARRPRRRSTGTGSATLTASTLHRLLGWRPARQRHPVPARPRQPAAARRGRGRRDVDGVADDDGPAARGGAAGRPADPGRRPRPARVGRGRCGARRPGRRAVRPGAQPGGLRCHHAPLRRADRPSSPRRCGAADADEVLDVLRSGADAVEFVETEDARARCCAPGWSRPPSTHRCARGRPRRGRRRWPRSTGTGCCARTATDRSACSTGTARSSAGSPRRPATRSTTPMYVGRPLLVTANDYGLGVYNGDAGVVVQHRRRRARGGHRRRRRAW